MQLKSYFVLFVILSCSAQASAQLNATLIGNASDQGNNCYVITPNLDFQTGGVWYDNPIDFDSDFAIYYQSNFGSQDFDGADGMALVFKRDANPEIGTTGGGIGYQGLSPSLVIEFDTYQNTDLNDPIWDHISIMRNGNSNHNNSGANLSGPVQASASNPNIEDGSTHEVKIEWNATTNVLSVYFDCQLRLTMNQEIKNTIFSGDDSVFFGFVGSTGGFANLHQVCFNRISFVDNLQLQDETVCLGNVINVDASIPSGDSYSWVPTTGVSDPNSANPILSPTLTTTYTVTISDICGDTTSEDITITVLPIIDTEPAFDAVSAICEGSVLNPLPTISNDGMVGTWSPELNNTTTTVYTFTPDNPCAISTTMEIVVNEFQIPVFDTIEPICEGDVLADLPSTSNNGITGSWSPAIDNTITKTYIFTSDTGQGCVTSAALVIVVNPLVLPLFDEIASICEGETLTELPNTSNNGITGVWSPALNNSLTTTYTFIPTESECAPTTTLEIIVNTLEIPVFAAVAAICEGEELLDLPTISNNGISGSWSPALDNSISTTYTFTSETDQCATDATLEIVVLPVELPIFDAVNPICPGEFLEDLPTVSNNGIVGVWSPAMDNLLTTVYTFTPSPGQGCAGSSSLEIFVSEPFMPFFDVVDPVCSAEPLSALPTVSNNGISGTWSPVLNNLETTIYTFMPDGGQCAGETTLELQVLPRSELSIAIQIISEPFNDNQTVAVSVSGGTGVYEFQLDDGPWLEDNVFSGIRGCDEYVIRARETSGCSNIAVEAFRVLEYPKFFTPNGDTENDSWNIDCLRDQVGARVRIYDRYGKIMAVIDPSRFGWDGFYNDAPMPTSDYWFKVEYFGRDGVARVFTSHFTLKR